MTTTTLKKPAARKLAPAAKPGATAAAKGAGKARTTSAGTGSHAIEDIRDAVTRLKRERIIATAVELFHGQGLNNTTLEAVAERMNVTKPFIYSHFKSKSDLLAEICSRGIRASLDVLDRTAASQGNATGKLQSFARDFMLAVLANQGPIAIYIREEKHLSQADSQAIAQIRREFDRKLRAMLEEGVASGEFIIDDVQIASLAIGGIVSWSYVWYRPEGRLSPEQTAEHVASLILAMVQANPARRKRV